MKKILNDLCGQFTVPQEIQAAGIYPYYRPISSGQDPVVRMADGSSSLMFGSNSYLGLSDDPRLKEAAIEAIRKYGPVKGLFMALKRILRCNPFCKGGYDPVV